jgi:predicted NBD/HSP70 family sugar kinase
MPVLSVDLRPTQALIAAFDLHDRLLTQEQVPVHSDPARSTEGILAAIQNVRAKHPGKRFEGIGVSVPGRVDPERRECSHCIRIGLLSISEAELWDQHSSGY